MYQPSNHDTDTPAPRIHEALGQSEAFLTFQDRLSRAAKVDRPVLIVGERGTGKELAAQRLHYLSRRWEEPYIELNCAALAPGVIESELFGHEPGAFTGASRRRAGRFEVADGGTLFLDELGNIPREVQEKILRVVEYGSFNRVGGTDAIRVDVRIIGATNADLPRLAEQGRFMRDLLDRLSFEVLYLPPLRARGDDIALLANHFAARMAHELGRDTTPAFSEEVLARLEAHPWRGNVRELKNVVERAVYCAESDEIVRVVFDPFDSPYAPTETDPVAGPALADPVPATGRHAAPQKDDGQAIVPLREATRALEVDLLRRALIRARYNQREAARLLGLSYHQFRGLYRKYREPLGGEEGGGLDL